MATVDRNTSEAWKAKADDAIYFLAISGLDFTAERVREMAGSPDRPNAMGSRMKNALRLGWVRVVSFTHATRPSAHARLMPVYRGSGV